MTIWLILGIIAFALSILGVGMIFVALKDDGKKCFRYSSFYAVIAGVIIFAIGGCLACKKYKAEVISYAMENYEMGNFVKSEYFVDGDCVNIKFSVGDLTLD